MNSMFNDIQILPRGLYLQLIVEMKLLDDAIIRSNEPEEVLTQHYKSLGDRFIIPWRKTKGKLRRVIMEIQRGFNIAINCHLTGNLCMRCPACCLFGGTGEVSAAKEKYNLLSRVLGDTFISSIVAGSVTPYTANAVDEKTLSTGQALMSIIKVPVETVFKGVVTLKDPTSELAEILVDGLEKISRIGASTREWGRVKTTVIGYGLYDQEIHSSYELANNMPQVSPVAQLNLPPIDEAYTTVNQQFSALLDAENLGAATEKARGKGSKKRKTTESTDEKEGED